MLSSSLPLTVNETLSGITGSISLAAWIFLLLPQLHTNYTQGNAEGISLAFLGIWFIGDVTNLAGAVWAGLVPTVVALAIYFCAADAVLIGQCLYYKWALGRGEEGGSGDTKASGRVEDSASAPREETPLLADGRATSPTTKRKRSSFTGVTEENMGLPGSRRRSSTASSKHRAITTASNLEAIVEEPTQTRTYLKNTLSVLGILVVGTAGWALAYKTGAWRPTPPPSRVPDSRVPEAGGKAEVLAEEPMGAMVLGYISAVCYLGARIPQIIKNQRERSCDGLSLLFFMLSLLGNATYGMGILFHSVESKYLTLNAPWLLGSLGTMFEDAIIFLQFHFFGEKHPDDAVFVDGEAVG